jgi:hypothetical protein
MGLEKLVSEDSRLPIQKLRRAQLWKIAKAYDIPFPNGAPASAMIPLLEGNGIDVTKPLPNGESEFEQVVVRTEKGDVVDLVPKEKEHYTKNKNINYDLILEKAAKEQEVKHKAETDSLNEKIAHLEAMVAKLLDGKIEKKEEEKEEVFELEPALEDMQMHQLKSKCKELGIKQSFTDKKDDLIKKIRDHNG